MPNLKWVWEYVKVIWNFEIIFKLTQQYQRKEVKYRLVVLMSNKGMFIAIVNHIMYLLKNSDTRKLWSRSLGKNMSFSLKYYMYLVHIDSVVHNLFAKTLEMKIELFTLSDRLDGFPCFAKVSNNNIHKITDKTMIFTR